MANAAEFRPSELVRLLSEADVDYVVVGGVAVVVQAHARFTDDLDICYATDRANLLTRLRRLRAINRRLTDRIARVNPPIGTDRSHDSAINIGLRTDRELGRLTLALKRSPDPAAELARRRPALATAATSDAHRWAQLRLKGCVGGPSQSLADVPAPRA